MLEQTAQRQVRCFRVYKGRSLVLRIEDQPGKLYSTVPPAPEGPPAHPFINAHAVDPASEHELGALLRAATSFDGYLASLINAAYDVASCFDPVPHAMDQGMRIHDRQGLAGVLWQGAGQFTTLRWQPEEGALVYDHATLTAYRSDRAAELLEQLTTTATFAELQHRLAQLGFRLVPIGAEVAGDG